MTDTDWPHWSNKYVSGKDFRSKKRAEVRKALIAVKELRSCCALTPATGHIHEALRHLEEAKSLMTVRKWKR